MLPPPCCYWYFHGHVNKNFVPSFSFPAILLAGHHIINFRLWITWTHYPSNLAATKGLITCV